MFKLTIEDDEGKTTVIPLIRDEMTVGRQEGNTIRLTERNVSRRHARLVRQNGTLFIEDLASFTGVRVNGAKIAALTAVREGDEVQIGDYKLMVRTERPPVAVNGDRATTPNMPSAPAPSLSNSQPGTTMSPMATVGGSVAIPTRATPSMAGQQPPPLPNAARPNSSPSFPAVPAAALAVPTVAAAAAAPAVASAAVPDPMEAQPTIPVRTLGEAPAPAPAAEAAPPARLVTLTTELAGMEFALSRGSLVVGRTDENEIVLNHRSISRHHAKVVREGDRYTIVDLQSANGVRVNGEDYERIELHPGDIVELGHVKLRFVGPFEHYVYDPKARYGRGRTPLVLGLGGVGAATVVAIAIFAVARSRPHDSEATPAQAEPAVAAASAPSAPAPRAPAGTPAPPPAAQAEPGTTPQSLLAEASRAAGTEDWDAARAALDRLGTQVADPAVRKQAQALSRRVDTERQGAIAFARFDEAQNAKNYGVAVARYDDIPGDSIYKKRATARVEEARAMLVQAHLNNAAAARAAGRCAEVKQEADEIAHLDPRNQFARDMVRGCKPQHAEPVAVALRPARPRGQSALAAQPRQERAERGERAEAAAAKRAEPAAQPPEPEVDVDALMKQAREAWVRQQCGSALDLSKRALRARPGMTDAYQIIAACSCSLKDSDGAARAYSKLDDKSRSLVRTLCQRNGVALGSE